MNTARSQTAYARIVSLGAIAATILLVAGGCAAPDIEDLREQGIQEFRNRDHIQSMATLRYALELAPNDPLCNYYMGLNYRAMAERKFREENYSAAYRELDTAIVYFTQTIKSWPNFAEAVAAKNEALESRGKYEQALKLAENVAQDTRGRTAVHFIYLGNEYRERGDYDNALRVYKIALKHDPRSSRTYAEMGILYERAGDRISAIDAYRQAYKLNRSEPGVAEALERLAG